VIGVLPIPKLFFKPPTKRTKSEIDKLQELCDRYYKNPKIESDDILNSRLHSIYLINIDKGFAKEMDPHTYLEITEKLQEKSEVDF